MKAAFMELYECNLLHIDGIRRMKGATMLSRTCLSHFAPSQKRCSRFDRQNSVRSLRSISINRQTLGIAGRRSETVTISQNTYAATCRPAFEFLHDQANHHDVRRPAVMMSQGRLDPPSSVLVAAFVSAVLSRNGPQKAVATKDTRRMTPVCNAGMTVESTTSSVSNAGWTYDIESNTDWLADEADRLRSMQAGTPKECQTAAVNFHQVFAHAFCSIKLSLLTRQSVMRVKAGCLFTLAA